MKLKRKIIYKNLEKELQEILNKIEKFDLPKGFLQSILYVINELFSNVIEHSYAKKALVELEINKEKFRFKIKDDGIGFRESYLRNGIYPKDDFSAIEFALSGLSTKDPKERGYGIYTTKKFVEALGGKLIIESGSGKVEIEENKINFQKLPKSKKGVSIDIEVPIKEINLYKIIK